MSVPSPWPQAAPLNSTRVRFTDKFAFWGVLWKDNQSFRMPGFLLGGSVDPVSSWTWAGHTVGWCLGSSEALTAHIWHKAP